MGHRQALTAYSSQELMEPEGIEPSSSLFPINGSTTNLSQFRPQHPSAPRH